MTLKVPSYRIRVIMPPRRVEVGIKTVHKILTLSCISWGPGRRSWHAPWGHWVECWRGLGEGVGGPGENLGSWSAPGLTPAGKVTTLGPKGPGDGVLTSSREKAVEESRCPLTAPQGGRQGINTLTSSTGWTVAECGCGAAGGQRRWQGFSAC